MTCSVASGVGLHYLLRLVCPNSKGKYNLILGVYVMSIFFFLFFCQKHIL